MRLLCQGEEQYRWCEEAVASLEWLGAGKKLLTQMTVVAEGVWDGRAAWESQLDRWAVNSVVELNRSA